MAKNDVEVGINVQDAQAAARWAQQRKWISDVEKGLDAVARAGRRAGKEGDDAFGGFGNKLKGLGGELKGMVGTFFTISTALGLIRREIDGLRMRNQNALDSQIGIAPAQRGAILAMGSSANISQAELIRRVESQNYVGRAEMYRTMQHAIGTGAMGADIASKTAISAAEFYPHLAGTGDLPEIAGGALAIQKSFGDFDPRQAVALLMEAQAVDPTTDPGKFARNIAGPVGMSRAFGGGKDSAAFLFGLASSIGQRAEDTQGAVAGTAHINFLEQVLEEGARHGLYKKGQLSSEAQLNVLMSNDPRAAAVRRHLQGALSDEFRPDIETAKKTGSDSAVRTRARTLVPLMELLEPNSVTWNFQKRAQRALEGSPAQIEARAGAKLKGMAGLEGQQAWQTQRIVEMGGERLDADPKFALRAIRQQLIETLYKAGGSRTLADATKFIDPVIQSIENKGVEDQYGAMADIVGGRAKTLRSPRMVVGGAAMGPIAPPMQQASADDIRAAAALERIETLLREQNKILMDQPNDTPMRTAPRPSPARGLNDSKSSNDPMSRFRNQYQ